MRRRFAKWERYVAASCLVVTIFALVACLRTVTQPEAASENLDVSFETLVTGPYHKPLRTQVDLPGVIDPQFVDAMSTKLSATEDVVGVVVDDRAFAFSLQAMSIPSTHIINLVVGVTPLTVTYCNSVDCARVVSRPGGDKPIELRVAGLDIDHQMVFFLDGVRYGQSSPDLPLEDYPFERTTLENWIEKYPHTHIFEG